MKRIFFIFLIMLITLSNHIAYSAESSLEEINKELPEMLGTNIDCMDSKNSGIPFVERLMPGLTAKNYDWHERRIKFKYTSGDKPLAIQISNQGNQDVRINNLTVIKDIKGDAFEFNRDTLTKGFIVEAGKIITLPVIFYPRELGIHELIFLLHDDFDETAYCRLSGVGVAPKLATYDYDFDSTGVNSPKEKVRRTIKIYNLEYATDTLVSDTVTIFDFRISEPGLVQTVEEKYNPNAWYFNKGALNLPKTLRPGDSLEFDAYFVAQKDGLQFVDVTTISSAPREVTLHWVGNGRINTSVSNFFHSNNYLKISPNPIGTDGGELTFSLASDGFTRIALYSINGELVEVLLSQYMERGEHEMHFDAGKLSSGVYKVLISQNSTKIEKSLYLVK